MPSAPSIGFEFRPSRWLRRGLIAIGLLVLLALIDSGVPLVAKIVFGIAATLYLGWACRAAMRRAVQRVNWRADGGWQLQLEGDADVDARLLGMRMLAGGIVLRLGWDARGQATLVLLPDNLDAEIRRRLRIRLSSETDRP